MQSKPRRLDFWIAFFLTCVMAMALVPALAEGPIPYKALLTDEPSEHTTTLQMDSGIPYGYLTSWKQGDQAGVVLQASILQYPLQVQQIECYMTAISASRTVVLRGHIYALSEEGPGALLGSTRPLTVTLGSSPTWVSLVFPTEVLIPSPQPFFAAVEYLSGTEEDTPSLVFDLSENIPQNICYYREGTAPWEEHYAFWDHPNELGYPIIRAQVETSGGPGDQTILEPEADALLTSGRPGDNYGGNYYLGTGEHGPWGKLRTLLRFPVPTPPIAGATPLSATLRLYHYSAENPKLSVEITAYRMITSWDESSVTWNSHAQSYAEASASATIPSSASQEWEKDRLIYLDLSNLYQKWFTGAEPNYGIILLGGEGTPESAKWYRSRESNPPDERPKLIIRWALPSPTPLQTPIGTTTPTPTITPTFTPQPTATPSVSPPPAGCSLFLPLVRKG